MTEPLSGDEKLIDAAKAGDSDALSELIELYSPRIYRFGMKMCRDEEDAREIVQDTLLAVARNVRDFRGQSSLSTWLYTIARSFCIKRRRKTVGEPDGFEPLETAEVVRVPAAPEAAAPDERAHAKEIEAALESAIDALDPMYREVLLLRDVEGLTAPEVAKVLEISVDAVKSRLHRARAAVREKIAPLFAPEPDAAAGACPDVVDMLSRHLENDVSPEACRELEEHVARCARCATRCDSLRNALRICQATPLPTVPRDVRDLVQKHMRLLLDELRTQS